MQIKTRTPFNRFPITPCSMVSNPPDHWHCQNLFALDMNAGYGPVSAFSVVYEGTRYSIPDEPQAGTSYATRAGASYSVLSVLRQLLIINTNAKSLPATSIISVRAP